MSGPSVEDLSTRFKTVNNRPLTPSETQGILTAVHENDDFFDPDVQTVFILGHYGEGEKPHLKAVQEHLAQSGVHPRLMADVFDFTEDWTAKFKLLLSYADTIVGVYEHSHGGHCWEAGFIDQYESEHGRKPSIESTKTMTNSMRPTTECSGPTCYRSKISGEHVHGQSELTSSKKSINWISTREPERAMTPSPA